MTVDELITDLIKREGKYSNNPADRGGPTMYGITENEARANGYTGDMRNLTEDFARRVYKEKYWTRPGFAEVALRSIALAEELLDTGVNMGPSTASKFLQRALNVLNRGVTLYPNLVVDGALGKMSYFALDNFIKARGKDGITVLFRMLNAQQSVRYIEIAENNASQEEFQFGWQLNRVV